MKWGLKSKVCGVDYWTDGSHLSKNGIPILVFGPGNIKEAHAAEEFISIDSLVKSAYCYIDLIDKLLGS
ncbi:M20/M25/M40 family metallo-hydrolase [endosymbiont 'TC1' of Trimyema compressum]|uniref:M20/M25/M40 family metallo-hydrolase n=1 Tax=endosymbiont 'TC1' of Trimyema compressum TaxID=243899 RepID=UPI0013922B24